jgi:hypothetical protein
MKGIVVLWAFLGLGHLITVDFLLFFLRFPFLTDTAKDLPVFHYLQGVHISFRPIFLASPSFFSAFRAFSLWLGMSCLGISAITAIWLGDWRPAMRRRMAIVHLLLSSSFCALSLWAFFIIPTIASAGIVILSIATIAAKNDDLSLPASTKSPRHQDEPS